jgi:phosphatidylinositol alpha-1,6-mannosyltransferase
MFHAEITDQEMIQCYQQCDLFILPNRTVGNDIEGFGMVLVEAQSCSKPVIAGDSGGTAETMLIGDSGYVLDCTNTEVMSNAISDLLTDKPLIKSMGEMGREHVVNTLDWQAHKEKASQLFQSVK